MGFELKNSGPSRGRLSGIVVACILLHLALAPQIHLFGGAFNFMLVLTVSLAISLDSRTMVYVGFFSGLLYDLTTTGPVGLMSLLLALVAVSYTHLDVYKRQRVKTAVGASSGRKKRYRVEQANGGIRVRMPKTKRKKDH